MLHSTLHWCYLLWLKLKLDNGKVGEQSRPRWKKKHGKTAFNDNLLYWYRIVDSTDSTVGTVLVVAGTKSN